MKKVLFIDQYNKVGGGQSVLIDLLNTFNNLGYECHVAVPKGGYIEKRVSNVTFHYLPDLILKSKHKSVFDSLKLAGHYLKVLNLYTQLKKYDYVYVNGPRYFILIYLLSWLVKARFIYHVHIDFSEKIKTLLSKISKSPKTYAICFTSEYLKNEFVQFEQKRGLQNSNKLHVIEPCYAPQYEQLTFRAPFSEDNEAVNIISTGRIIPEKGFDLIIDAAQKLPEYNFHIVGAPENDSLVYNQTLKARATPNVYFHGNCDDVPAFIQSHHINVAVIPSAWHEPFGIVAIESMRCSCLTFVRNRGGLLQIAQRTGALLFEDANDLRTQLQSTLMQGRPEKNELTRQQYTNTQNAYSQTAFIHKIASLLQA